MTSNNLRIAMLAAHSCPVGELGTKDTGGMSVYIRELASELGKQGHTVDVYTRVHDPADPIIVDLGERARLVHVRAGQEAKINKLEVYSYLPEFTYNLESYRANNGLQYDIVFSHYWLSGWVGKHLQQWWRVPHVIMFHTMGAVKNAIGIGEGDPALRIESEKESVDDCHSIIVATERGKEEVIRYYGALSSRIGIVPCGVNMDVFKPVDKKAARQSLGLADEKTLLYVGRFDPLKGVEQLMKTLPLLKSCPGLKLVLIGGDDFNTGETARLNQLAGEMGIQDSVIFRGTVKQAELHNYYSAADICVVPSYYESFGLVALEALACGTPVVAADVGDLKNIILQGETGCVVGGNSPAHLAQGIDGFLAQPPRDMEARLAIRASVDRYSWAEVADALVKEFHAVRERTLSPIA